MNCLRCGKSPGAQPFETRFLDQSMLPQRHVYFVEFCARCAGQLCQELIRYLKGRKQESDALRKRQT